MANYIKEIGKKGISLQFLWNIIGGLVRSSLILIALVVLGGGLWLVGEDRVSIFSLLAGLTFLIIISILITLLCNREKLKDEQLSDLLSVSEMNRIYIKDILILEALEKTDLTERDNKETREIVDSFIRSIDTAEGKAALILLLKRKNYSSYNPDERIDTEENTDEA